MELLHVKNLEKLKKECDNEEFINRAENMIAKLLGL